MSEDYIEDALEQDEDEQGEPVVEQTVPPPVKKEHKDRQAKVGKNRQSNL